MKALFRGLMTWRTTWFFGIIALGYFALQGARSAGSSTEAFVIWLVVAGIAGFIWACIVTNVVLWNNNVHESGLTGEVICFGISFVSLCSAFGIKEKDPNLLMWTFSPYAYLLVIAVFQLSLSITAHRRMYHLQIARNVVPFRKAA